jgi:hypothetical protein
MARQNLHTSIEISIFFGDTGTSTTAASTDARQQNHNFEALLIDRSTSERVPILRKNSSCSRRARAASFGLAEEMWCRRIIPIMLIEVGRMPVKQ